MSDILEVQDPMTGKMIEVEIPKGMKQAELDKKLNTLLDTQISSLRKPLEATRDAKSYSGMGGSVEERFSHALANMLADAQKAGHKVNVVSGKRTIEQQADLYNKYKAGKGNLAAKPSPHAPHVAGYASDLNWSQLPAKTRNWIRQNAAKYNLHFPVKGEPWHAELIGARDEVKLDPIFSEIAKGKAPKTEGQKISQAEADVRKRLADAKATSDKYANRPLFSQNIQTPFGNIPLVEGKAEKELANPFSRLKPLGTGQTAIGPRDPRADEEMAKWKERVAGIGLDPDNPETIPAVNEVDKLNSGELLNLVMGMSGVDPDLVGGLPDWIKQTNFGNRTTRQHSILKRYALNRMIELGAENAGGGMLGSVASNLAFSPLNFVTELETLADPQGVHTAGDKLGAALNLWVVARTAGSVAKNTGRDVLLKEFSEPIEKSLKASGMSEDAAKTVAQNAAKEYVDTFTSAKSSLQTAGSVDPVEQLVKSVIPATKRIWKNIGAVADRAGVAAGREVGEAIPEPSESLFERFTRKALESNNPQEMPGKTRANAPPVASKVETPVTTKPDVPVTPKPLFETSQEGLPKGADAFGKVEAGSKEPPSIMQLRGAIDRLDADEQTKKSVLAVAAVIARRGDAAGQPLEAIVWRALKDVDPSGKLLDEYAQPFYSKLERVVEEKIPNRATSEQIRRTLEAAGVKPEEMQWTKMDDILRPGETISKQDLLDHLQENQVRIEEVWKGGEDPSKRTRRIEKEAAERLWNDNEGPWVINGVKYWRGDLAPALLDGGVMIGDLPTNMQAPAKAWVEAYKDAEASARVLAEPTKFSQYATPGGENYRELLLTLPRKSGDNFTDSHWDEPNVLAHIRFDERVGPNGERVLHVAEIQSDWHQKGRKQGYGPLAGITFHEVDGKWVWMDGAVTDLDRYTSRVFLTKQDAIDDATTRNVRLGSKGVPDAPFKKTWHELALKRILRYAAENDFDRVSWDTGITNAERYDLSKQVDSIKWYDPRGKVSNPVGAREVTIEIPNSNGISLAVDESGRVVTGTHAEFNGKPIDDVVGKEIAQKIMGEESGSLSGSGLKVGGEGMKGFYDKMLPDAANKIGKRFGARVEASKVTGGYEPALDLETNAWVIVNKSDPEGKAFGEYRSQDEAFEAIKSTGIGDDAHAINITPEMKASLLNEGQPLFSKPKGVVKGAYSKRTIELVEGRADASTILHEVGHYLHDILRSDSKWGKEVLARYGDLTDRAKAEQFVDHFLKYLETGKAPTTTLQEVFATVKEFLKQVLSGKKFQGLPKSTKKMLDEIFKEGERDPVVKSILDELNGLKPMARAANKNTNAARLAAGLDEFIAVKRRTLKDVQADADTGDLDTRVKRAMQSWEKRRILKDTEILTLGEYARKLWDDMNQVINDLLDETKDRDFLGERYAELSEEFDKVTSTLKQSGTATARALAIRAQILRADPQVAMDRLRAFEIKTGKRLDPKQRKAYEAAWRGVQDANANLEKKLREAISKSVKAANPDSDIVLFDLADDLDDLMSGDIEKAVLDALKNGKNKVDDLVDHVTSQVGHGASAADLANGVKSAISKAKSGIKKSRAALAKEIRDTLTELQKELKFRKGYEDRRTITELEAEITELRKQVGKLDTDSIADATERLIKIRDTELLKVKGKIIEGRIAASDMINPADAAELRAAREALDDTLRIAKEAERLMTPQTILDWAISASRTNPLIDVAARASDLVAGHGVTAGIDTPVGLTSRLAFSGIKKLLKLPASASLRSPGEIIDIVGKIRMAVRSHLMGTKVEGLGYITDAKLAESVNYVPKNAPDWVKAAFIWSNKFQREVGKMVGLIDIPFSSFAKYAAEYHLASQKAIAEAPAMALGDRKAWIKARTQQIINDVTEHSEDIKNFSTWVAREESFVNPTVFTQVDDLVRKGLNRKSGLPIRGATYIADNLLLRFFGIFGNIVRRTWQWSAAINPVAAVLTAADAGTMIARLVRDADAAGRKLPPGMREATERELQNLIGYMGAGWAASNYLVPKLIELGVEPESVDTTTKIVNWGWWEQIPGIGAVIRHKLTEHWIDTKLAKIKNPNGELKYSKEDIASWKWWNSVDSIINAPLVNNIRALTMAIRSPEQAGKYLGKQAAKALIPAGVSRIEPIARSAQAEREAGAGRWETNFKVLLDYKPINAETDVDSIGWATVWESFKESFTGSPLQAPAAFMAFIEMGRMPHEKDGRMVWTKGDPIPYHPALHTDPVKKALAEHMTAFDIKKDDDEKMTDYKERAKKVSETFYKIVERKIKTNWWKNADFNERYNDLQRMKAAAKKNMPPPKKALKEENNGSD